MHIETTQAITAWHASRQPIERFEPFAHFGSLDQARMRSRPGDTLQRVTFCLAKPVALEDRGSWTRRQLLRLRRTGHDGAVYLNRYEGITLNSIVAAGDTRIDSLTDRQFQSLFPEAGPSWVVFDPNLVSIVYRTRR